MTPFHFFSHLYHRNSQTWKLFGWIFLLISTVAALYYLPTFLIGKDLQNGKIAEEEIFKNVNDYRKVVIQLVGGIVVAIGLYSTWRRLLSLERIGH